MDLTQDKNTIPDAPEVKPEQPKAKKCPNQVPDCHLEVDIILQSPDGTSLGTHIQNLELYSEGFGPFIFELDRYLEQVELQEDSTVLKLLLQYMHLCPQPDPKELTFDVLERLANASEKYLVHSATMICRLRMEFHVNTHTLEVFRFAVRHGHHKLADMAARLTLVTPYTDIEKAFGGDPRIPRCWLQYREGWNTLLRWVHTGVPRAVVVTHKSCRRWSVFRTAVQGGMNILTINPLELENFRKRSQTHRYELEGCPTCASRADDWCTEMEEKCSRIPAFSTFLTS